MPARLKISVQELRSGMYVAELDRPWLETPFLFQGFLIRSEREIEEICRYCSWVWVDRQRSETGLAPKLAPMPGLEGFKRRAYPKQKATMGEELPRARDSLRQAEQLVSAVTSQLRMSETLQYTLVEQAVDPIIESVLRNQEAMIWLQNMRGKDEYTFSRSVACSVWGVILGRHLGLDRAALTNLATGGLLLDLGKVSLPDELLTRRGPLTPDEIKLVRRHVDYGVAMLEEANGFDPVVIDMVRTHHERYNGTGYPKGLVGTEIPPLGKIAGILDTFVAMTSQRPYADAMATYDVMRHLNDLADVEFQAELVEQFIQAIGMFPTGSLVELSTGEIAIVTAQNRIRRLRPAVMIVTDCEKAMLGEFRSLDLRSSTTDEAGEQSLWITRGLPPGSYGIDPEEFFL